MDVQRNEVEKRCTLVHLIRSGKSVKEAAGAVERSPAWGYKWWKRYRATGTWCVLESQSRRPKRSPRRLSEEVRQQIRQARSELEAAVQYKERFGYFGAQAVRVRLQESGLQALPSVSSIERELRRAGMTHPRQKAPVAQVVYPHLRPARPHELIQADILPRFLSGGAETACFNAIDVVSRYASGRQYEKRTAANAVDFL